MKRHGIIKDIQDVNNLTQMIMGGNDQPNSHGNHEGSSKAVGSS
jgi:hypothetical protein